MLILLIQILLEQDENGSVSEAFSEKCFSYDKKTVKK